MIRFDIDERYLDDAEVGSAISPRESVLMSVVLHGLLLVAILFAPDLPIFQPSPEELQRRQAAQAQAAAKQRENRTFVFVKPQADLEARRAPERAELSDKDRRAQAPAVAPQPANPLPYAKGTTTDRVEDAQVGLRDEFKYFLLRLRGRGLRDRKGAVGDLFVRLHAQLPSSISPELAEAIQQHR